MTTKPLMSAIKTLASEFDALERELAQSRKDVERLAEENNELCDMIDSLNKRLNEKG